MPSAITRIRALVWLSAVAVVASPVVHADINAETSQKKILVAKADVGASSFIAEQHYVPHSCQQPDATTLRAIVPVATDHGSHASGVVFAEGLVLTAAHAVKGANNFFVRVEEVYRRASLILVDHSNDLAVLSVKTDAIQPITLAPSEPLESQPVWAVGYPRAQEMMTSTGVFQRNREGDLHTSASIDSGQSGGGLLSCQHGRWQLMGMLRGYGAYLSGDRYVKLENHSVSVGATTIHRFLNSSL